MDQIKIGAFLGAIRKEKGLTQEQLGERLGVTQKTVSRWETGWNMPDLSTLPAICDVLDINIAELMSAERVEGEQVTKSDTSNMARDLIRLATQKKNSKKIVGAILSALLTVVCMVGLYQYEFSINVETTADLETAINEYHFNDELSSDILERTVIRNKLYVLYEQGNHPGASGLACLEKGIFGRYRIISCTDVEDPLIFIVSTTCAGQKYMISFGVNQLPNVSSYAVYGYDRSNASQNITVDDEGELLFSFAYEGSPFLTVTEISDHISIRPYGAKYFDETGKEISKTTLKDQFDIDINAVNCGYGTAELGMLYFFEAVILILGIIFIRYFLTDVIKQKKP